MAGEGKIHVIENHLASNDNEEDVIFDQVDFKGMRFSHHILVASGISWFQADVGGPHSKTLPTENVRFGLTKTAQ